LSNHNEKIGSNLKILREKWREVFVFGGAASRFVCCARRSGVFQVKVRAERTEIENMDKETKAALEARERDCDFLLRQMQKLEDEGARFKDERDQLLKAFTEFVQAKGSFDADRIAPTDAATSKACATIEALQDRKPKVDDRQLHLRLVRS